MLMLETSLNEAKHAEVNLLGLDIIFRYSSEQSTDQTAPAEQR